MVRPVSSQSSLAPSLAALVLLTGPFVLIMWLLRYNPSISLAAFLSDDGALSADLLHLLRLSQLWIGVGLTIGLSAAWFMRVQFNKVFRLPFSSPPQGFAGAVIVISLVAALFIQEVLFDGIPHVTDATSHSFQAQIFRMGRLAVPSPPCSDAFFQHGVVLNSQGLWHSKYYPGTALGLACLGRGFLPLSFAILLVAFYLVARHYIEEAEARLATILVGLSPMMLLLAGSFMSHVPLLMWMALAWLGTLYGMQGNRAAAIGAGFAAGMGILTRPLDGTLLGALIGLVMLFDNRFLLRRKWACLGLTLCGLAIPSSFLAIQNIFLYGTPFTTGYNFSHSAAHYQIRIGLSDRFPFAQACKQGGWILARLNQALLGWPSSFLFIVYLFWAKPRRWSSYLIALIAMGLYTPYFLYFYYGFEFEARYTFAAVPLLCILAAQGIRVMADHSRLGWAVPGILVAFYIYAAAYYWPAYLWSRYAGAYEEATPELHRSAQAANLELPALVLLPNAGFGYSSGFIHNDPLLQAPIIYARDIPAELPCLTQAFPERRLYRWQPTTAPEQPACFTPIEENELAP